MNQLTTRVLCTLGIIVVCMAFPAFANAQAAGLSIRRFDISPSRVYQNEIVRIIVEIENTGNAAAESIQVGLTSDKFSISNSTVTLGSLSQNSRRLASFDAKANSDAALDSKLTAKVSSSNAGSFSQTKDVAVQPFGFSVSDPSIPRLTKNEVSDISFSADVHTYEAADNLHFTISVDTRAFEVVQPGRSYPTVPAGTFSEPIVIRSEKDADSKNYPVGIGMTFEDKSGKETHSFLSPKSVYVSWCTIWALAAHTDLAPTALGLIDFRDNTLMKSVTGQVVLSGFYQAYGLVAPLLTDFVRSNPHIETVAREAVRPGIYILSIAPPTYSLLSFSPDLAFIFTSVIVIGSLASVYAALPALASICLFLGICRTIKIMLQWRRNNRIV